jgi:hypothetical protein
MSGPGASNGSTGETSVSGISPADPEQKKVANGEVQQSATSIRKRKRNGRGHQRLASEDLPRQPEPAPLLRHQRLASADLPRQRPPKSVMRSRDRASPNTAVPVSPRLESTPNVPSRVVSEAVSERPDAATTGNGRSAGGQLLALAVPSAEAIATVSAPGQPQVLPETPTEPLPEATAARLAGAQWTREQQETKNRELSVQLMTDLMAKIGRLNLVAVFEILNKLTAPNLQRYRAESLGGLTLRDEEKLHHVNHLMNYIRQDLLPTLSAPERARVKGIVEEWQKLDLPRAEARPLAPWVMTEVMVALKRSDLTPPSGLAPGANG